MDNFLDCVINACKDLKKMTTKEVHEQARNKICDDGFYVQTEVLGKKYKMFLSYDEIKDAYGKAFQKVCPELYKSAHEYFENLHKNEE